MSNVFSLNKVAYHNSCNSNMVSLDLTKNTHISGSNAVGKTAKLNGVQIGYLPFMNFKDLKKKYDFGQHQNPEESYKFYFPENDSYIIYEFENEFGKFCQIVYRGKEELSTEKAFVPLSLDDIYQWFWEFSENDEVGRPTRIQISELLAKIKEIPEHKIIKTLSEAKNTLYVHDLLNQKSRYAIAYVSENKIDNLINIFRLTANANNIKGELLRKSLVSLINSSYQDNKKDALVYDPIALLKEYERLQIEHNAITRKKNHQKSYEKLKLNFEELTTLGKDLSYKYSLYDSSLSALISDLSEKISVLTNKRVNVSERVELLLKEKNEHDDVSKRITAALKEKKRKLDKLNGYLASFNALIDKENGDYYFDYIQGGTKQIIQSIDDEIAEQERYIKSFDDMASVYNEYKAEIEELESCKTERFNLMKKVNNGKDLLFFREDFKKQRILHAINKNFEYISNKFVSEENLELLNKLCDMFTVENNSLYLDGVNFARITFQDIDVEKVHERIRDLGRKIIDLEESIKKAEIQLSKTNYAHEISNSKNVIEDLKKKRTIAYSSERDLKDHAELCTEIEVSENDLADAQNKLKVSKEAYTLSAGQAKELNEKMNSFENAKKMYNNAYESLDEFAKNNGLKVNFEKPDSKDLLSHVDMEHVKEVKQIFSKTNQIKSVIRELFSVFIKNEIIYDETEELMNADINYNNLKNIFKQKIENVYNTLDNEEEELQLAFRRHSNLTLELTKNIKNQIEHFSTYTDKLNRHLSNFSLSNVEQMRLKVKLNDNVESFVNIIEASGLEEDNALSRINEDSFIEKIRIFVEKFGLIDSKNEKLNADKIIQSVFIEYKNNGEWTSKPVSTGTEMISKISLLSVFIYEICGDSVTLSIPVNLDETGNIDANNMQEINKFLSDRKIRIFSASPTLQLGNMDSFSNFVSLYDYNIYQKELLLSSKFFTTYHYFMGSSLQDTGEKDIDFSELENEDLLVVGG